MIGKSVYYRPAPLTSILFFIVLILSLIGPNPFLTVVSLLSLALFTVLLWRLGEPPVLLFAIEMQWLQATLIVFYADAIGLPVTEVVPGPQIERAVGLSLLGLCFLALGMRCGILTLKPISVSRIHLEMKTFDLQKLWAAYLLAFIAVPFIQSFSWEIPELTQILLNLVRIKWVIFFLLAYCTFVKKREYFHLLIAVCMEIVVGLTGFFAGFKDVFFVLIVVLLTLSFRMTRRTLISLILALLLLFHLSVLWTAIKIDFREYVSGGTRTQVIMVSFKDRILKLEDLIGNVGMQEYTEAIPVLVNRIAQVDVFGHVLERVPSTIPHEHGSLWKRAFKHILMPRLFFTEKSALPSDSDVTNYYTGMLFAGAEVDTSYAIGYIAETYIDFGVPGICVGVFLLGLLWGLMYKYFMSLPHHKLFGYATSVSVLVSAYKLEVDNVHLLGGLMMGFIVMALVLKFVFPLLNEMLLSKVHAFRARPYEPD